MTTIDATLAGLGGWFALNMGASGLAPAFGAVLGARAISPRRAVLLFAAFVTAGAVLLGPAVARTLASGLVPPERFDATATLIVLGATNVALLVANLVSIPQSTSWVTVAAITALGVHDGHLATRTLTHRMLPAWGLLPLAAFAITAVVMRALYPLHGRGRLDLHAWLRRRTRALRALALASSCYVALAIGANNVANAVGPLSAAGVMSVSTGLWAMAPLFGAGAALLGGPARTIARGVVPLGLFAATLCNVVVASLLLVASWLGLPQSLVQLNAAAVLGVALVKEGAGGMLDGRGTRRMLRLWVITPILAAALTYLGLAVAR